MTKSWVLDLSIFKASYAEEASVYSQSSLTVCLVNAGIVTELSSAHGGNSPEVMSAIAASEARARKLVSATDSRMIVRITAQAVGQQSAQQGAPRDGFAAREL